MITAEARTEFFASESGLLRTMAPASNMLDPPSHDWGLPELTTRILREPKSRRCRDYLSLWKHIVSKF